MSGSRIGASTEPAWLKAWQSQFTAVIRSPLDPSSGTFQSTVKGEEIPAVSASVPKSPKEREALEAGLKVYHRQYWFRLFSVMQQELPLTARLLGYWTFNQWAQRYLLAFPPTQTDIAQLAQHFATYVEEEAQHPWVLLDRSEKKIPKKALVEATLVDQAWHKILHAPPCSRWQPDAEVLGEISHLQLNLSPKVTLVKQSWPWMQQREAILKRDGSIPLVLPSTLKTDEWWILMVTDSTFTQWQLPLREAEFYDLLRQHPLGEAMARWELKHPGIASEALAPQVTSWLSRSMEWGMWSGCAR